MIVIVQISEQQYALSGSQDTKQNTYHIMVFLKRKRTEQALAYDYIHFSVVQVCKHCYLLPLSSHQCEILLLHYYKCEVNGLNCFKYMFLTEVRI